MFRSLATAASGMEAQQTRLDVTANNIANVSTNGFKQGRAEFADLMYQELRPGGAPTGTGTTAPTRVRTRCRNSSIVESPGMRTSRNSERRRDTSAS